MVSGCDYETIVVSFSFPDPISCLYFPNPNDMPTFTEPFVNIEQPAFVTNTIPNEKSNSAESKFFFLNGTFWNSQYFF